jgi:hypothetical protein
MLYCLVVIVIEPGTTIAVEKSCMGDMTGSSEQKSNYLVSLGIEMV